MSKEDIKKVGKVTVEVSKDCLTSLKILALKKEVSLGIYVTEVMEKHIESKKKIVGLHEETI